MYKDRNKDRNKKIRESKRIVASMDLDPGEKVCVGR